MGNKQSEIQPEETQDFEKICTDVKKLEECKQFSKDI